MLLGLLLGLGALGAAWWHSRRPPEEVGQYFPRAAPEAMEAWAQEYSRRGTPWEEVPDPPGEGPVATARFWLARDRYDMEVRRRGSAFVVSIGGVAGHVYGGAWRAFGEGRITGGWESGFAGVVATFSWSCLGLRYRHASDGLGRIVFDPDGQGCHAIYMAWEAPEVWAKSYGRRHEAGDSEPDYGAIEGQIPYSPRMPTLPAEARFTVDVRVLDAEDMPIPDALVQLKGRPATRVRTDAVGAGTITFLGAEAPYAQAIAAGATGYRNGEISFFTGDAWPGLRAGALASEGVVIQLARVDASDHPAYAWQRASGAEHPDDVMACGTCHPWHYDQWYESRHARMADNAHVTWERERMLATDASAPDDCVGCHQPAIGLDAADGLGTRPTWKPRGVMAGNHCDYCHKIQAVLDPQASGSFGAYRLARPDPARGARPGGIHHVFGSAPDVTYAYMGASYNPLFQSSQLCAGCHQGGGRHADGAPAKIDTFEEWKLWAGRQPEGSAQTCLDCHMPANVTFDDDNHPIDQMAWDALHRSTAAVHDHRFPGTQPPLAALALDLSVHKERDPESGAWRVAVTATNVGGGHKVPTGTWSKHVVVGVWAEGAGRPLRQLEGDRARLTSTVPDEALAPGDWRSPGGFVLGMRTGAGLETAEAPPVFWAAWPEADLVDTRLAPGQARTARCVFEACDEEPTVEVRVLYRRGWLPGGAASVPWTLGANDPPPEVLWKRIRK